MERDWLNLCAVCAERDFNSHAHVERDGHVAIATGEGNTISTHTLTWSVTYCSGVIFPLSAISTHTLTWSVTLGYYVLYYRYSNFNSHAHVERDP